MEDVLKNLVSNKIKMLSELKNSLGGSEKQIEISKISKTKKCGKRTSNISG